MTKQSMTIPEQKEGETDGDFARRLLAWFKGDDVRSKVDNREWTGSLPFHLNREPQ